MRKYYIIQFENEELDSVDAFDAICEAVMHCELYIFSKYDIQLQRPIIVDNRFVVLEIGIPDNKADTFVAGRCLRSISDYLVHVYGYSSKKNYRLIRYSEIPKPNMKNDDVDVTEHLELISKLIRLISSSDPHAKDKLERINNIINESSD